MKKKLIFVSSRQTTLFFLFKLDKLKINFYLFLAKEMKICGGATNGGLVCCSADMESRLQIRAKDKHDKATKEFLQRLQNTIHTRAVKFHGVH